MHAVAPGTTSDLIPSGDRRRWAVLAILSASLLLIAMDTTILNVAFPSLVSDLQPTAVEQLWIIDIYALALSGLLVTAGALGDRWGRKRVLLLGFAIFAGASLIAVFAVSPWQVIAARALLGAGGAAIMPATLSILRSVFTDARERAFAYAVWAAVLGGGMALGPVIGGLLVERQGWHSAFLLNVPVAVAVIVVGGRMLPESYEPREGRWDWWGVVQSMAGMFALVGGIKQLGKGGPGSPVAWGLLAVAAVVLTIFVRRQARLEQPLLQVRLFTSRPFSIAASTIFLGMIAMGAALFLITQWFQYGQGYSPITAGVRLLPAPLGLIVTSLVTPTLMHRLPIRHVLGAGLVLMAAGLALPWVMERSGTLGYPAVAVSLGVIGAGVGVATTAASVTLMASAPARDVSGAAAVDETSYELGAAMGVAVLGSLATALYRANLPELPVAGEPAAHVRDSIGEAAHVAGELGGPAGTALLRDVSAAFTSGMTPTFLISAILPLAAAVLAWAMVPRDLRPTENPH
ncbi:MFS transporter [Streptomyces sp. AJS327]|uniref:MFS transporter n=1 Tax=Streptomyces sp. AJS327 TaxID=2545265 RepID=UPI0015E019E6|nr:MFS transporter [Streptomyces sp. AJS327]MBA0050139.1 MFS transporter [Streptomyces sp. AJS327]